MLIYIFLEVDPSPEWNDTVEYKIKMLKISLKLKLFLIKIYSSNVKLY